MSVVATIPDTGEIVEMAGGKLALPGRVSVVGLELPEGLSLQQWQGIGETLRGVERSLMWWIGDWLLYGEKRYGETYKQAMEATGAAYQTLANAKAVSQKIEFSRRREICRGRTTQKSRRCPRRWLTHCWAARSVSACTQLNDTWGRCVPIDVIDREVGFRRCFPRQIELFPEKAA